MLIVVAILILLVSAVIFTRAPLDVAMVGCLLLLVLTGQVAPESAFLGFSNTAVLMIGALFVVASGLRQTGAIDRIAPMLIGRPMSVRAVIGRLGVPVTALSGFMNTTPLVAMFLPVTLDISRRLKVSPSRVLMPLSFAGILGGQLTLVGTASNIVIDGLYSEQIATWAAAGIEIDPGWILEGPARFLAVGVSGVVAATLGLMFLVIAGPWILPDRGMDTSNEDTDRYEVRFEVQSAGPIAGKTIEQAGLRHLPDLFLVAVERQNKRLAAIGPDASLQPGDILCFVGSTLGVRELRSIAGIEAEDNQATKVNAPTPIRTMVEAVVSPTASFVGRTVRESQFRTIYNAAILAVHRRGTRIEGRIGDITLDAGDVLLLETHQGFLTSHGRGNAFYLATSVENARFPRHDRAPVAIAILLLMIISLATGLLSPVVATWVAALAMVGTRCVNASIARKAIDFSVLITIGAAIGIGMAVAESGLGAAVGNGLVDLVRSVGGGERLLLATVVIAASLIAQFATNFGSAVIMFPVAVSTAMATGASPLPFVLGVMAGAGSNFLTPFGYQTNLMVFGPGRYKFIDFPRLGLPLLLIVIVSATIMIPAVFPFR
jgi:di/tricarboxylate transporter